MRKYAMALVLLATLAYAVPRMVPFSRGNAELKECLAINEPLALDALIAMFEEARVESANIGAGQLVSVTPSADYLRATNSPILALVPEGDVQVLWLRCAQDQYAFGEDRL
jgi:hypothetical protein